MLPVCLFCHDWIHRNVAQSKRRGFIVSPWNDPATTPVIPGRDE